MDLYARVWRLVATDERAVARLLRRGVGGLAEPSGAGLQGASEKEEPEGAGDDN